MAVPKFELKCRIEQKKVTFFLKIVSQSFVSDMHLKTFELIFLDGDKDNILLYNNDFPTSLNYTDGAYEFIYDHESLKNRPIIAKELKMVFTLKDDKDIEYYCEATKDVQNMHNKQYAQGLWKTEVFIDENCKTINEDDDKSIEIEKEIISACAKIADNPVSYRTLDEDGLNRAIRDLLKSSLERYKYSINDQTQQGYGQTEQRSGEIDILITQNGIPVAICEGLVHKDEQRLHQHIDKAIGRYNQSGCKTVVIIEYSRNQNFSEFWEKAQVMINNYKKINVSEICTNLMGVKEMKGSFIWQNDKGTFLYVGVNCYK